MPRGAAGVHSGLDMGGGKGVQAGGAGEQPAPEAAQKVQRTTAHSSLPC